MEKIGSIENSIYLITRKEFKQKQERNEFARCNIEIITQDLLPKSEYGRFINHIGTHQLIVGVKKFLNGKKKDYEKIIERACNYWNMSFNDLIIKTKKRDVVEKRQILQFLLSELSAGYLIKAMLTKTRIGDLTGVDHSTVIHSVKTVRNLYEADLGYRSEMDTLLEYLGYEYKNHRLCSMTKQ